MTSCANCGAVLVEGQHYCSNCGLPLQYVAPPVSPPVSHAVSFSRRWLLLMLSAGSGCLALMLLGLCILAGYLTLSRSAAATSMPDRPPATAVVDEATPPPAGRIMLEEDFNRPERSAFLVDEDASLRYAFEDGAYLIEVKDSETLVWSLADGEYRNVALSVEVVFAAVEPLSAGGLIFHYQDEDNFYLFSLSSDGLYSLDLIKDNQWYTLIDWTETDAIAPTGSPNRLQVETVNDRITLLLNDTRLEITRDNAFTAGAVALAASSFEDGGIQTRFDNLLIIAEH